MAKTAKPKSKAPPKKGRPTLFRTEYIEGVRKLAAHGLTVGEIARFLEVSERSIYQWRHEYPEFEEAFFAGLKSPNARVEVSLYRQAIGYYMDDEEIKVIEGKIVRVPIRKWYPPVPSVAIYWSKVKMGWRDNPEETPIDVTPEAEQVLESPRQIARRVLYLIHKAAKEDAA